MPLEYIRLTQKNLFVVCYFNFELAKQEVTGQYTRDEQTYRGWDCR